MILANFFLLFALAAFLFEFSTLWSLAWWLMHLIRLIAYLTLLRFFLKIYSQDIGYIRKSRLELKKRTLELEKTQSYLSDIIEYSPTAITLKDISGKFIIVNKRFSNFFTYTQEQLIGKKITDLFSDDIAQYQLTEDKKVMQRGTATKREETHCHLNEQKVCQLDEEKITFIVDRFPLKGQHKNIYGVGTIMTDISERKKNEAQLKAALIEKESLLKEIHHRVKNNLQIVASLMFLQAQKITNPESLEILQESQERIKSMSLVHELLYQCGNLSKVPFKEYIETLAYSLRQSYNAEEVIFQIETEPIDLPVDTAVPCGLIVNELITNSLKHAFQSQESSQSHRMVIHFFKNKTGYLLSVSDNGPGFPKNYDWDTPDTLGVSLIQTLSNQLDAELTFENHDGLTCRLHFSA